MAEEQLLRSVELRLLRCTLSTPQTSPLTPPTHHPTLLSSLLLSIEQGNYQNALSSSSHLFFEPKAWEFENSLDSAADFYNEVERSVTLFLQSSSSECSFGVVMCVGVAALLAFTQQNVTGPVLDYSPFPLLLPRAKNNLPVDDGGQWDVWARNQLTSVGCDLLGKFTHLQYLVYAKILLSKIKDLSTEESVCCLSGARSISWWLCRLTLLQQRILDELSSSLYDLLHVFKDETLRQFGELKNVVNYWGSMLHEGEASTIVSTAQLEAAIVEYKYGRVDSSGVHLGYAEEACGMHLSLTGVLGFRTIHQVDAKPQLVLVPNTDHQINGGGQITQVSHAQSGVVPNIDHQTSSGRQPINVSEVQSDDSACGDKWNLQSDEHHDCSDILMTPKLVENDGGHSGNLSGNGKGVTLSAIQQAVVLAQCLHLKRRSRDDELSRWEMAPYIEAIDDHHQSCYAVRCFCDILRIRWESTRSHTKQRALLMMDKLVKVISEASPTASQRIQFSYGVYLPTIPSLRKEYGELLVSCGLVREALKIFEDLELWDNLIYCYRLLDKKAAAVDLIKARLVDMPTDPRLWCSLGDVTNSDAHYEKALEVSSNRSARAKRSLARSAYNRGDYETSKILWESAMATNSLYPDGWFALGAAALKARDIDKALDAFTHAVQLDPENGEAWNNVACLHMIKKRSKPAFIAFKEALKFRRNSWQLWENYSHVALDIDNFSQALEATKMVLDLSTNKRVDIELLDKVMTKVEERASKFALSTEFGGSEIAVGEPRENDLLLDMLGRIFAQVVCSGGGAEVWGLYARWHKVKGNLTMCSEALLKQVRSYQGSDLWHDRERFKKFAHASLQLCNVYMEIASSTGSHRELMTAEMHLRNSVKQAVSFSDTEELQALQACLEEIKQRLNSASAEGA